MSETAVEKAELVLAQAAVMAEDDETEQGGPVSDPLVPMTGAVVGEWFSKLSAPEPESETAYLDEFAKAFECNTNAHEHDLENALWWVANLLDDVVTPGFFRIQSSSAADNSTKKQRTWMLVGSSLIFEDIIYNGTTQVTGFQLCAAAYRTRTLLSINDAPATLTGNGAFACGSQQLGGQPANLGWATGECDFGAVATLDDDGTSENRLVAPDGMSFSRCRSVATALSLGTLTAGSGRGLWGRLRLRRGMPPVARVDLKPRVKGSSN